jgi:hypothetical protein
LYESASADTDLDRLSAKPVAVCPRQAGDDTAALHDQCSAKVLQFKALLTTVRWPTSMPYCTGLTDLRAFTRTCLLTLCVCLTGVRLCAQECDAAMNGRIRVLSLLTRLQDKDEEQMWQSVHSYLKHDVLHYAAPHSLAYRTDLHLRHPSARLDEMAYLLGHSSAQRSVSTRVGSTQSSLGPSPAKSMPERHAANCRYCCCCDRWGCTHSTQSCGIDRWIGLVLTTALSSGRHRSCTRCTAGERPMRALPCKCAAMYGEC